MFKSILSVAIVTLALSVFAPGNSSAGQPGYRSIQPYTYSRPYTAPYRSFRVYERPYGYPSYRYSRSGGFGYSYGYGYSTPYSSFYRGPVYYSYPSYSGYYRW